MIRTLNRQKVKTSENIRTEFLIYNIILYLLILIY